MGATPEPTEGTTSPEQAQRDLQFMAEVVKRTHARVDPHLFHYVHWGLIVLVWYPAGNWLQNQGRLGEFQMLSIAALILGIALSMGREFFLARKPRIRGENTVISRQVQLMTASSIGAGILLSALAPGLGILRGEHVPILWGLVYANLAFSIGVVYRRDFLYAGIVIFAGTLLAMVFHESAGYLLGPFMGLGMIVPGLRGEARVKRLIETAPLESR